MNGFLLNDNTNIQTLKIRKRDIHFEYRAFALIKFGYYLSPLNDWKKDDSA